MRQKVLQCVVTFESTTDAMRFEEIARESELSGRIIPLPKAIGAGCGLAWREDPQHRVLLEKLFREHRLKHGSIYELEI